MNDNTSKLIVVVSSNKEIEVTCRLNITISSSVGDSPIHPKD